eukprot:350232-Chlamydomonas_euryale.AAC.1
MHGARRWVAPRRHVCGIHAERVGEREVGAGLVAQQPGHACHEAPGNVVLYLGGTRRRRRRWRGVIEHGRGARRRGGRRACWRGGGQG